jgi:hypothetical protein
MTFGELSIGGCLTLDLVLDVAHSLMRWLSYVALISSTWHACLRRMVACMGVGSTLEEEHWALGGRALSPRSIGTTWHALGG